MPADKIRILQNSNDNDDEAELRQREGGGGCCEVSSNTSHLSQFDN